MPSIFDADENLIGRIEASADGTFDENGTPIDTVFQTSLEACSELHRRFRLKVANRIPRLSEADEDELIGVLEAELKEGKP